MSTVKKIMAPKNMYTANNVEPGNVSAASNTQPGTVSAANSIQPGTVSAENNISLQNYFSLLTRSVTVANNGSMPVELRTSKLRGRFLVASRDLHPGILFTESCIITGPHRNFSKPVCLGCFTEVKDSYSCQFCGLPFCSEKCLSNPSHADECKFLAASDFKTDPEKINGSLRYYYFITPLRCLLLKETDPDRWQQLINLESHSDVRLNTSAYKEAQKNIVEYLQSLKACTFDSELIHKVCGIIDTNCFETNKPNSKALYPLTSMFNHNCSPNTECHLDENSRMVVKILTPVRKNQELSISYIKILSSTLVRRKYLLLTKYFLCNCLRCKDPTEFQSFLSAFRCQKCAGLLVPNDPLKFVVEWRCLSCQQEVSAQQILFYQEAISKVLKSVNKADPKRIEEFIQNYRKILPPEHYIIVDLKQKLIQSYGHIEGYKWSELSDELVERKLSLCKDVLDVVSKVQEGETRLKGFLSYRLYNTILEKAKRMGKMEGEENRKRAKELLQEAVTLLRFASSVLEDDVSMATQLRDLQKALQER